MVSRCLAHSLGDGPWSVRDFRSGLVLRSESGPGGGGPDTVDIVAARFSDDPKVMGRFEVLMSKRRPREGAECGVGARMQEMQGKTLLKTATRPAPRMS